MELASRGGLGECSTSNKSADGTIPHTFRLREGTLLRLAQQFTYYRRRECTTSWDRFFTHIVELLERVDPASVSVDPSVWPGGRVLTAREQRVIEAQFAASWPWLMLSPTVKEAYLAVRRCPFGPERTQLFRQMISDLVEHEIGQSRDVEIGVNRAAERQLVKEELTREHADAQWSDRGRFDRDHHARRDFRDSLDPGFIAELPTYRMVLERAGIVVDREEIDGGERKRLPPPAEPVKDSAPEQLTEPPRLPPPGREETVEDPEDSDETLAPEPPIGNAGEASSDESEENIFASAWESLRGDAEEDGVDFKRAVDGDREILFMWRDAQMFKVRYKREFGELPP